MGLGMFIGALTDIFTRSNGEVSVLGAEIGAGAYSKEFEMEADYLSLYYLARAGYDYKSAGKIQKYLLPAITGAFIGTETSHPCRSCGMPC